MPRPHATPSGLPPPPPPPPPPMPQASVIRLADGFRTVMKESTVFVRWGPVAIKRRNEYLYSIGYILSSSGQATTMITVPPEGIQMNDVKPDTWVHASGYDRRNRVQGNFGRYRKMANYVVFISSNYPRVRRDNWYINTDPIAPHVSFIASFCRMSGDHDWALAARSDCAASSPNCIYLSKSCRDAGVFVGAPVSTITGRLMGIVIGESGDGLKVLILDMPELNAIIGNDPHQVS